MRIAIPYADGAINPHFGHTETFKLYNLEDGKIVSDLTLPAFGSGHQAMAELLQAARADVLICGGIGVQAQRLLAARGVAVYPGFGGSADDAAQAFASGVLQKSASNPCGGCAESCGQGDCSHHGESSCCGR